jgi:hypothetical protein
MALMPTIAIRVHSMISTSDLRSKYGLPKELTDAVDRGTLDVISENEAEKTVEFAIPDLRSEDEEGRITTFSVVWIHPDHNAEFCHYFDDHPGDLPNFYVSREITDVGDDLLEIDTVDELLAWLESQK